MQRPSLQKLCGLLATTAIALVLIGCNGKAGQNGVNGAPGAPGNTYVNTVNASQLTQAEWSALNLQGAVSTAAVSGKPTVTFTITNDLGTPVSGLTAANMGFGIAKLIPQSGSAPSRWVNYGVASSLAAGKVASVAFPDPEKTGTLKDNLDGTYTYTFALDISQAQAAAAAAAYDANHLQADLDALTYDATLVHRVIITVGGNYGQPVLRLHPLHRQGRERHRSQSRHRRPDGLQQLPQQAVHARGLLPGHPGHQALRGLPHRPAEVRVRRFRAHRWHHQSGHQRRLRQHPEAHGPCAGGLPQHDPPHPHE